MIYSGKVEDISWPNGTWLILDIGFSNSQKSCGILLGDEEPKQLKFNDAIDEIIKIANNLPLLNLVIEAPLSVTFDKFGNPKSRSMEKEGGKNRLWYVGPGCAVLVAGMYLMRKLYHSDPTGDVRLFEGFVSYQSKDTRSNHLKDVELLREAIKSAKTRPHRVIKPEEIKTDPDDNTRSAFEVMNLVDIGIPPIIKINK